MREGDPNLRRVVSKRDPRVNSRQMTTRCASPPRCPSSHKNVQLAVLPALWSVVVVVEPVDVEVMVGTSSKDLPLKGGFQIAGDLMEVAGERPMFTRVTVA